MSHMPIPVHNMGFLTINSIGTAVYVIDDIQFQNKIIHAGPTLPKHLIRLTNCVLPRDPILQDENAKFHTHFNNVCA